MGKHASLAALGKRLWHRMRMQCSCTCARCVSATSALPQHPPELREHLPRKGLAAVPQLVLVQLLQHLMVRQRHWHKLRAAATARLWRSPARRPCRRVLPRGPASSGAGASRCSPVYGLAPGAVHCQSLVLCRNGCQDFSLQPLHDIQPRHPAQGAQQGHNSRSGTAGGARQGHRFTGQMKGQVARSNDWQCFACALCCC